MGLDYSYTCPVIDSSIKEFKESIKSQIYDLVNECCPLLDGKTLDDFIEGYADAIYDDLESAFEDVRSSNEDMRSEADTQIDDLELDISRKDDEITDLNAKIEELETLIAEYEDSFTIYGI